MTRVIHFPCASRTGYKANSLAGFKCSMAKLLAQASGANLARAPVVKFT
jgi:hypothetical protein